VAIERDFARNQPARFKAYTRRQDGAGSSTRVQEVLIDEQVRGYLAEQTACPQCGPCRAHKDTKTIVMRTLFGTVRLASPRWYHCACQSESTRTFCPLAAALPERATPELLYLESKFAGLVSYGQSA
jgi:hypothetical protein